MASAALPGVLEAIQLLWEVGAIGGLTDSQLLERFLIGPEETSEAAFAALVERHGPTVRRVCLDLIGDLHEAQDAAQATFLVLARRARSIRKTESLGSWLHGVALRLARRARAESARRRQIEQRGAEIMSERIRSRRGEEPDDYAELHEEIDRLPEKYRSPIILCYFQGQTQEQAAQSLGWPLGTVQTRLHRGREQLRTRLTRRGLGVASLSAMVPTLPSNAAIAVAVPPGWSVATARAAVRFATGVSAAELVPAAVSRLAEAMLATMLRESLKAVAFGVMAVVLATAGVVAVTSLREPQAAPAKQDIPPKDSGAGRTGPAPGVRSAAIAPADGADRKPVVSTLRGTVLTGEDAPAEGAEVWAAAMNDKPLDRRETRCDAQGAFALGLDAGDWLVWARRDTQGSNTVLKYWPIKVEAGQDPAPLTMWITEQGLLRGLLVEAESGKPIPGGKLTLDVGLVLTADDRGRFELSGLHRGKHEAIVVAPGRQRMRVVFDLTGRRLATLEIPVPRGGKVVGRVTDTQGRPIPGAYVRQPISGSILSIKALQVWCDPDGRFEWDGVRLDQPGNLEANAPGYEPEQRTGWVVAEGKEPLELNFRLESRLESNARRPSRATDRSTPASLRTLKGTVSSSKGQPVGRALVRWEDWSMSELPQTRSDSEGRFTLENVPDQKGVVSVVAPGLEPAFARVAQGGGQELKVSLMPGHMVAGTVVDDEGKPLADVWVVPQVPLKSPTGVRRLIFDELDAQTDLHGRFRIEGLPREGVLFDLFGNRLSTLRRQELILDREDQQLRMQHRGAIQGRVVDSRGMPVRNFRVFLGMPHKPLPGDVSGGYEAGYSTIGLTFTSSDGTFTVSGLTANNTTRVTVRAAGFGDAAVDSVTVHPANHMPPVEELTLKLPAPHQLRVRVVEAEEERKPVFGAHVILVDSNPVLDSLILWYALGREYTLSGSTNTEGWADFPGSAIGEALVLVRAPGYGTRHLAWRKGERELEVEMKPQAVLTGEVLEDSGAPMARFTITLVNKSGDHMIWKNPSEGARFTLDQLPASDYTLTIDRNGGPELHVESFTLAAGQTLHRSIRVAKDAKQKARK